LDDEARQQAIVEGMDPALAASRCFFPRWHPNQLLHTFATEVRKRTWGEDHKPGVEAAKVILGHTNLNMTDVYAEDDRELAMAVIRQIG